MLNKKYNIVRLFSILIVFGLILSFLIKPSADQCIHRAEKSLQHTMQCADEFVLDTYSKNTQVSISNWNDDLAVENMQVDAYLYKDDTLREWTNYHFYLEGNVGSIDTVWKYQSSVSGDYLCKKYVLYAGTSLHVYILLKSQYLVENYWLKDELASFWHIEDDVDIYPPNDTIGYPIRTAEDRVLLTIDVENTSSAYTSVHLIRLVLDSAVILLLFLFGVSLILLLREKKPFAFVFGIFILYILIIELLLHVYPFEFYKLYLFHSEIYASFLYGNSLGKLLFRSIILFGVSILFRFNFPWKSIRYTRVYQVLVLLLLTSFFLLCIDMIRSLIFHSTISFHINNFSLVKPYFYTGIFVIFILVSSCLLLADAFYRFTEIEGKTASIFTLISSLFMLGYGFLHDMGMMSVFLALCYFIFMLFLHSKMVKKTIFRTASILVLIASLCTMLITQFNQQKEDLYALLLAKKLILEQDVLKEYMFNKSEGELLDNLSDSASTLSSQKVKERFIYPFSKRDLFLYNAYIESDIYSLGDMVYYPYNMDSLGGVKQSILEEDSIELSKNDFEWLFFEQTPSLSRKNTVYSELLTNKSHEVFYHFFSNYSFAVYQHDKLIYQEGECRYSSDIAFSDSKKFVRYHENEEMYRHTIYKTAEGQTIVVSIKSIQLVDVVSMFSYLLCFFLTASIFGIGLYGFGAYLLGSGYFFFSDLSFRTRINLIILGIVVVSFIIIGSITVYYLSFTYDDYYRKNLEEKQLSLQTTIEQNNMIDEALKDNIKQLASLYHVDINVYDVEGKLLSTSRPEVVCLQIVSNRMNANVLSALKESDKDVLITDEMLGKMTYLSGYSILHSKQNEVVGYLNIPFVEKKVSVEKYIASFMNILVNAYLILLFLAGVITYFISNSIINPLVQIGKKLRLVNLNEKNKPIQWHTKDEIGALVKEYNRMISQLEHSAILLARSERESAWRGMARQVAHEIKNPLTPMKLSIQHLKRTMQVDPERAKELMDRVTKTLIEQIDNLSEIASAFSSFAQVPVAKQEVIDLKEIIEGIVGLFNERPEVDLKLHTDLEKAEILADKNQMISAFNNLVKNAIQATEDIENRRVDVTLSIEEELYKIAVKDNGIGIPEETHDKIFVPNFTTKTSGTGLGLAITLQIIENAQGALWFDSELGEGTTFFIVLPIYKHYEE